MRAPRTLYDLRYYARHRGYRFSRKGKIVTVPECRRSKRVETRLQEFGYAIQLNIFGYEN